MSIVPRLGVSLQDWECRTGRGQREKTLGVPAREKLKCETVKFKLSKRVIKLRSRGLRVGVGRIWKEWSKMVSAV